MVDEDFSHLDEEGRAHMIDVGDKEVTERAAVAEAALVMTESTRDRLFAGDLPKGDALAVARVAGIMAAKRTPELIPLCHPLPLTAVSIEITPAATGAVVTSRIATAAKTGVEMEAMTAAAVAALSLYDMVKGVERGVEIGPVRLLLKTGGRTGEWRR